MQPAPSPQIAENLNRTIVWWICRIREALARYEAVPVTQIHFAPNRVEGLKYLNWRVWCIRYCVTLDFIIEILLTYFKNQRYRKPTAKGVVTVGLSPTAITGTKAREIIEQAILKRYPQGENRAAVRSDLVNRILRLSTAKANFGDGLRVGVAAYRLQINVKRQTAASISNKFHRPWRGNPWR